MCIGGLFAPKTPPPPPIPNAPTPPPPPQETQQAPTPLPKAPTPKPVSTEGTKKKAKVVAKKAASSAARGTSKTFSKKEGTGLSGTGTPQGVNTGGTTTNTNRNQGSY